MNIDKLNELFETGLWSEKFDALDELGNMYSREYIYQILLDALYHKVEHTRFFALTYIINKFSDFLKKADDQLIDKIFDLFKNDNYAVVDRARWALAIVGEKGIIKLLELAKSGNATLRIRSMIALAKSGDENINAKKNEIISTFLNGLDDEDEGVKYYAMVLLIQISPLQALTKIEDYDFTPIYEKLKPIMLNFIKSTKNTEMKEDVESTYHSIIKNEKKA